MKKITLLLLMFAFAFSSYAQADYYQFSDDANSGYPQVSSSATTLYTTGDDQETTGVPIGFDFYYGGHMYSTCTVGVNGAISFTESQVYATNNLSSTNAGYINMIAPLWDDLRLYASNSGYLKYETTGTTPNRIFTVSWFNISHFQDEAHTMSFLVQLHETSNQIVFYYGHIGAVTNLSASIGFNVKAGTNTGFISATPGSPATVSRTTSNNSIAQADFPDHRHYTFSFTHTYSDYNFEAPAITLADPRASSHETYEFNNLNATDSGGSYDPTCADFQGGDVWFKFVAPTTGAVNFIKTGNGNFSSGSIQGVALYHNTYNSNVVECLGLNGHASDIGKRIIFNNLVSGDTYYLRMWDYGNDNFGYMPFYLETIIPNDEAVNALNINVQPENASMFLLTFANNTYALGSQAINGTPTCGGYSGGDLWYKFTATSTGEVKVHHTNTEVDWSSLAFAVYDSPTATTPIDCNFIGIHNVTPPYDTFVVSGLTAGDDYWLRVWDYDDDNIGGSGGFFVTDNDTASIEDYQSLNFKFYPNPATDVLNVSAVDNIDAITLTNILGQKVKELQSLNSQTSINIADLKKGIYFMTVKIDHKTSTVKVVKK